MGIEIELVCALIKTFVVVIGVGSVLLAIAFKCW